MVKRSVAAGEIDDSNWIHQSLFVPNVGSNITRKRRRSFSSADIKFYDTTPGGNKVMNPRPQFTRVADPKVKGLAGNSKGMGRYYSEAIDDNVHMVTFQFGIAEFNSLSQFVGNFYNPQMATLTNRGEQSGISYKAGYSFGFIMTLPLQAYFGVQSVVNRAGALITGNPYSKFYYMKETMPLYWNGVTTLYNELLVNMGLVQGAEAEHVSTSDGKTKRTVKGISNEEAAALTTILPDVFKVDGQAFTGVDVYSVSTRAQRIANAFNQRTSDAMKAAGGDKEKYAELIKAELGRQADADLNTAYTDGGPGVYANYEKYMQGFLNNSSYQGKYEDPTKIKEPENLATKTIKALEPTFRDHFLSELRSGSAFVSFAVEGGSYSESFSNSVKTSELADKLKGVTSKAKDFRMIIDGVRQVGGDFNPIEWVTKQLMDFGTGMADSVGLDGIFGILSGNAYVDIPKVWDDSSAELGRQNYKIRLQTPYGNKLSVAINIYLPLCMLLVAALPRSTGKNSYTSPFLCRVFAQGKTHIKLGMIDSLNVTRAVGNIQWTADNLPNAVDVDIGIMNLDEIMHIPVTEGLKLGNVFSAFDEDSAMSDYLSTLGSLSLYDQYYVVPRVTLKWRQTAQKFETWATKSHFAQWTVSTLPGEALAGIANTGALPQ